MEANRVRQRLIVAMLALITGGGMIIAALTDIAGSSDVVDRGFVTYSNAAKIEMLGAMWEIWSRMYRFTLPIVFRSRA